MTDEKRLGDLIARIIDRHRGQSGIHPSWIATEAMNDLDPQRISPPLVFAASHLQLRQIARGQLRNRFDSEEESKQHELWPDLQTRYPTERSHGSAQPEYVRLEDLADEDVAYNIARLRKGGRAMLKHADKLEDWWLDRKARGDQAAGD